MDEENELVALRRKKLDALRAQGVEPFGAAFETSGSIIVYICIFISRPAALPNHRHTHAASARDVPIITPCLVWR